MTADFGLDLIGQLGRHIARKTVRQRLQMVNIDDSMPGNLDKARAANPLLKASQGLCRLINAFPAVNHQSCLVDVCFR